MSSPGPVIKSKQKVNEVNGIPTQVVCTEFSNYIFVVLTQYGKIGSLISITPDSRSNDISTPTFSTKVLMGKDEVSLDKTCINVNTNLLCLMYDKIDCKCHMYVACVLKWIITVTNLLQQR